MDPRLPVIVGVGEAVRRDGAAEPVALMAEATRAALADAGAGDAFLARVDAVAAPPPVGWRDGDPARHVCERLGIQARTLRSSMTGGNGPQLIVNAVAERIQSGALGAAIVCGAEALGTAAAAMRRGAELDWPPADPERSGAEVLEGDRDVATEEETAVGILAPIMAYPLIENAIRAASGRTPAEHLALVARMWARFSEVAARQPAAWSPQAHGAEELATPAPGNRLVTFPYTKLLNANIQVDQGAALLLCSAQTAAALGIARERWVFVHAGARATDEWHVSHRRELHRSPAIRACGAALFEHAGIEPAALGPVDLYSCFPAAVQLAASELGLPADDPERPLTCTGGLTFFGGPGNNYATHGIAAVARELREAAPGSIGLASALGWYATKHALGLYGNAPPQQPFASYEPRPEHPEPRAVAEPLDAEATAETCTVVYDRSGEPSYGILFALLADGRRALCRTEDPGVLAAMPADGFLGARVRVRANRSFSPAG